MHACMHTRCARDGLETGYAADGDCDDGGPGAEFTLCDLGTDCTDCGPRVDFSLLIGHSPSPPSVPPPYFASWVEPSPPSPPTQPGASCWSWCRANIDFLPLYAGGGARRGAASGRLHALHA